MLMRVMADQPDLCSAIKKQAGSYSYSAAGPTEAGGQYKILRTVITTDHNK